MAIRLFNHRIPYGTTKEDVYLRVDSGSPKIVIPESDSDESAKVLITFTYLIQEHKDGIPFDAKNDVCEYDETNENLVQQIYLSLKKRPEFSHGEDV